MKTKQSHFEPWPGYFHTLCHMTITILFFGDTVCTRYQTGLMDINETHAGEHPAYGWRSYHSAWQHSYRCWKSGAFFLPHTNQLLCGSATWKATKGRDQTGYNAECCQGNLCFNEKDHNRSEEKKGVFHSFTTKTKTLPYLPSKKQISDEVITSGDC